MRLLTMKFICHICRILEDIVDYFNKDSNFHPSHNLEVKIGYYKIGKGKK